MKQRHGCLTAYLILMIVANSATSLLYVFAGDAVEKYFPTAPDWSIPVLGTVCLFNVACAIALFRWQKWGFFGFIATSVIALVINIMIGVGIAQILLGLAGLGILYWTLRMGKDADGWSQLE